MKTSTGIDMLSDGVIKREMIDGIMQAAVSSDILTVWFKISK